MAQAQKFLLITNSEYGQANVNLAVAYELSLRPNVEVHVASFLPMKKRIASVQNLVRAAGSSATIHFHLVQGKSFAEGMATMTEGGTIGLGGVAHPPGFRGAMKSFEIIPMIAMPWSGREYIEVYTSCLDIITAVGPHAILLDFLFKPGADACKKLGLKHIILSPNSLKEIVLDKQPWLSSLWKYPICSSGYPYPLPWHLIPANIYLKISLIYTIVTSAHLKDVSKAREECGLGSLLKAFEPCADGIHQITPSSPSSEFPFPVVPDNVTCCGPILLPAAPVEESDPELAAWLDSGPAVLINLGTHALADAEGARQMGGAIRILLDREPDVRVLWKAIAHGDIESVFREVLGAEMDSGRVRITAWLNAEPLAILRHPNLVLGVNHGGANSWYEAFSTGTPQVVLPVWYDTYDFAQRSEYLGNGIYGNPTAAPGVDAAEFGKALTRAVGNGEEAVRLRAKAKALAEENKEYTGRVLAVDKVLELAAREYIRC